MQQFTLLPKSLAMIPEIDKLLVEENTSDAEMTIGALKKHALVNKLPRLKDAAASDSNIAAGQYAGKNIDHKPTIRLPALKMPRLSGIELLQPFRTADHTLKIPVLIFMSSKEDPDFKTCYYRGRNSDVVKTVLFGEFPQYITQLGLYRTNVNQKIQS